MKKWIIFAGGLLVGGLSGYFTGAITSKKYYQKFYQDRSDAEVKGMKDYYNEQLEELNKKKEPFVGEAKPKIKPDIIPTETYVSLVKPYQGTEESERIDYSKIQPVDISNETTLAEQEHPEDDDDTPREIGELEFGNHSGYEEVTVYCYSDKKNNYKNIVLVEEQHSELIELIDLGRENVLHAVHDEVTDIHYIRNPKLGIDYYLITDDRTYEEIDDAEYDTDEEQSGHWEKDDNDW